MLNAFRVSTSNSAAWLKNNRLKLLGIFVLGCILSAVTQWLLASVMMPLLLPLQNYLGNIMWLQELLTNRAIQIGITAVAIEASRRIVNSNRFQNSPLLSKMSVAFKTVVGAALPPKPFVRLARILPIGSWIEYTPYFNMDDFQYAIMHGSVKDVEDLMSVMPKDTFYRMLSRRNEYNNTRLFGATLSGKNPNEKFRVLLSGIAPEDRFSFLTTPVGRWEGLAPLVHQLDFKEGEDPWDIAMELLDEPQRRQLALHKDQRGDSLLMSMCRFEGAKGVVKVLKFFSNEERKAQLKELCPHGTNPVVELFTKFTLFAARDVFSVLPKEDWQEIFNTYPENWTMTIGEKVHLILTALNDRYDETLPYFIENFGTQLPKRYEALRLKAIEDSKIPFDPKLPFDQGPPDEYGKALEEIKASLKMANCDIRHNFKIQHGESPERLLGIEPNLEKSGYIPAYRRLQRKYHPDKNPEGSEMAVKINKAKDFIENKKVRKGYRTPSPYNNGVVILCDSNGLNFVPRKPS